MDLQLLKTYDGLYKEIFACYWLMNIVESLSPAHTKAKRFIKVTQHEIKIRIQNNCLYIKKKYQRKPQPPTQRFLNWDIAVWDKTTHGKQNTCKNCSLLIIWEMKYHAMF